MPKCVPTEEKSFCCQPEANDDSDTKGRDGGGRKSLTANTKKTFPHPPSQSCMGVCRRKRLPEFLGNSPAFAFASNSPRKQSAFPNILTGLGVGRTGSQTETVCVRALKPWSASFVSMLTTNVYHKHAALHDLGLKIINGHISGVRFGLEQI